MHTKCLENVFLFGKCLFAYKIRLAVEKICFVYGNCMVSIFVTILFNCSQKAAEMV